MATSPVIHELIGADLFRFGLDAQRKAAGSKLGDTSASIGPWVRAPACCGARGTESSTSCRARPDHDDSVSSYIWTRMAEMKDAQMLLSLGLHPGGHSPGSFVLSNGPRALPSCRDAAGRRRRRLG